MKKILSVLLALSFLLSFSACSSGRSNASGSTAARPAQTEHPIYPGLKELPQEDESKESEFVELAEDPVDALAHQCIQALFAADMKAVFDMVHPDIMSHYMELGGIDNVQYDAMIERYNAELQTSLDQLDGACEQWTVSSSIIKKSSMTPDYLITLSNNYASTGLVMQAGYIVHLQITVTADGQEFILPESARLSIVQIDDTWYLDMSGTSF